MEDEGQGRKRDKTKTTGKNGEKRKTKEFEEGSNVRFHFLRVNKQIQNFAAPLDKRRSKCQ